MLSFIFKIAYRNIWTSKNGRPFQITETVLWSFAALTIGFWWFDNPGVKWYEGLFLVTYWMFIICTPLAIPGFIYIVHLKYGGSDPALLTTPVRPYKILLPRVLACLVSWVRLFAPILLLMIISHENVYKIDIPDNLTRLLMTAIHHLTVFPYHSPLGLTWARVPIMWFTRIFDELNPSQVSFIIFTAFCQVFSWVLLPITWGFWWASRVYRRGSLFMMGYYSWLVLPAILIPLHYWMTSTTQFLMIWSTNLLRFKIIWPMVNLSVFLSLGVAIVLFFMACISFGRRDK